MQVAWALEVADGRQQHHRHPWPGPVWGPGNMWSELALGSSALPTSASLSCLLQHFADTCPPEAQEGLIPMSRVSSPEAMPATETVVQGVSQEPPQIDPWERAQEPRLDGGEAELWCSRESSAHLPSAQSYPASGQGAQDFPSHTSSSHESTWARLFSLAKGGSGEGWSESHRWLPALPAARKRMLQYRMENLGTVAPGPPHTQPCCRPCWDTPTPHSLLHL